MTPKRLTDASIRALPNPPDRIELPDSEVRGLRLRLSPTGARSWIVRARVKGGAARPVTIGPFPAISTAEARDRARRVIADLRAGVDVNDRDRKQAAAREAARVRDGLTVAAALDEYIDGSPGLRPNSVRDYRAMLALLLPRSRSTPLASLTEPDIRAAHRARSKASRAGADKGLRVLRAVARYAERLHGIKVSLPPVGRVSNNVARKRSTLNGHRAAWIAAVRALPDDERTGGTGTQRDVLLVLLATGSRLREIAALRWDEVDMPRRVAVLDPARHKGHREHVITFPRRAWAIIERRAKARADADVYVFEGGHHGKPLGGISRGTLSTVARAAGVPFTAHDLRREYATAAASLVPALALQQLLGHANAATSVTAGYVVLADDALRGHAQVVEDALFADSTL